MFCGNTVGLFPFTTAYHASKFAVEGFTESLRQEITDFGINVILIEPGFIGSNFMDNMKTAKGFDPNKSPYANMVSEYFKDLSQLVLHLHPSKVAHTILNVAIIQPRVKESRRKRCRIYLQSEERTI